MQAQRKESLMSESESEKVQIYFGARNLADLDIISVTDSFLRVYLKETNKPRKQMLKTKIYWNDLNPDYAETLITQFFFEIRQMIEIEVYHEASPPKFIGKVQASIGEIFGARQKGLVRQILDKQNKIRGEMIMKCEKLHRGSNNYIEFDVEAHDLSSCFCWPTKYLYRLYKMKKNNQFLLYQSPEIRGPTINYGRIKMNQKKLCNNNQEFQIYLHILKYHEAYAPTLYGKAVFTLKDLARGKNNLFITDKDGQRKGTVLLKNIKRYTKHEFSDFLMSGMQMALVICIDFTASNGAPSNASSLHYTAPHKMSQYQEALKEVTNILMDYDADKLVPTYGFGAKVRLPNFNTGVSVHHCFPLNGNTENPNFFQLEGIMQGYRQSMKYLQFGGPTYFAPLLREAMNECERMKQERKQYMILMILTDGAIHDKDTVKDLLVKCGKLPLSVIIVGIGSQGDWGIMHELDDDDCQMTDFQGNKTIRDLVQFVQFSQHKNNGVELAREVLFELPRQVQEYHQLVGIVPNDYKMNLEGTDAFYQMRRH